MFRGLLMHHLPHHSTLNKVLFSCVYFGLGIVTFLFTFFSYFIAAHSHHFIHDLFGSITSKDRTRILKECIFKVLYTSVFGSLSSFLYLRTGFDFKKVSLILNLGSLVGSILSHSMCNLLGLPNFESKRKNFSVLI